MVSNHPQKNLLPLNPGKAPGSSIKPSKNCWKSDDQVNYLISHWLDFKAHQAAGALDRFWPRVFDGWYQKWPVTSTPEAVAEYGSPANAVLALRLGTNSVRV